ncbi:MAG: O-antigen ligase family protein [Eubacteriales bacterium]|nr:O-antigen ligase family protein [Eubacteriales bacterium]
MQDRAVMEQDRQERLFSKPNIALYYIVLVVFAAAIKPDLMQIAAFAITPAMFYLFLKDEFYVLVAIFIFFYKPLIYIPGEPMYRIYTYLFFVKLIVSKRKIDINLALLPSLAVFILYIVFVVWNADTSAEVRHYIERNQNPPSDWFINAKKVFQLTADLSFAFVVAYILNTDRELFKKFFILLIFVGIASGIYGFSANNIFNYNIGYSDRAGTEVSIVRYMGSFDDPNYAGMFLNIALFAVVSLKIFRKSYVKFPLLLALYYYIIASGSITALVCNAVGWVVFIILRYRLKSATVLLIGAAIASIAVYSAINLPVIRDLSVVRNIELRLENQFKGEIDSENTSALTSGRTKHWQFYMDYYKRQDIFKKLFGGNIVLTSALDPYFQENNKQAPHQAFIGFLMNFGLVGTIVIILCFLAKNVFYVIYYFKQKSDLYLLLVLCNFIWAFYGISLDYFADWKFMFFYFL